MAERGPLRSVEDTDQLAMDERVVTDDALAKLLDRRLQLKDNIAEIRGPLKEVQAAIDEALTKHPIEEGAAIRIGRHRIAKVYRESRHVEAFDTNPKWGYQFSLWDQGA